MVNDHRLVREGGWVYKRKHLTQMAAEDEIVTTKAQRPNTAPNSTKPQEHTREMTTGTTTEMRREKPSGVRDETHEKTRTMRHTGTLAQQRGVTRARDQGALSVITLWACAQTWASTIRALASCFMSRRWKMSCVISSNLLLCRFAFCLLFFPDIVTSSCSAF